MTPKTGFPLLCLFVLMHVPFLLSGQDIIYKTDHTIIEAKVLKISGTEVEYKRFSNQDGPVYSISRALIQMIIYQNGEKEVFDQAKPKRSADPQSNTPAGINYGPVTIENARMLLLSENFMGAVSAYAQLVNKDSDNVNLCLEYAYALGLEGIYDAALMRLDGVWQQRANNPDARYYAAQVYALMGYDQLSTGLWEKADMATAPSWVSSKAPVFAQKYKEKLPAPGSISRVEFVTGFKLANRLTAQNYHLQSIGLFEEIIHQYPEEYLPYVGYSIALEKAGLAEKSAKAIETALLKVGNRPEAQEKKQFLVQRLASIDRKINTPEQTTSPKGGSEGTNFKMLAYAGGMFTTGYSSFNMRAGYFMGESSNVSIDLGLLSANQTTRASIGMAAYFRRKILVYGSGITGSFGKDFSAFYFKFSAGPSFMNQKKTASYDLFWDLNLSASKKNPSTFGFSIGRSVYFGKRKQTK